MQKRLLLFLLSFLSYCAFAQNYLFRKGTSEFAIHIEKEASTSEKTAAKELQEYIKKIGDVILPITNNIGDYKKVIFVGWNTNSGVPRPDDDDESFTYKTLGDNIYIYGGSNRGTMYGVFSFIENELGVRWYTSRFTKIPQKSYQVIPEKLCHTEKPAIKYRLNYYYDALNNDVWCARNRLNTQCNTRHNEYGDLSAYWGIHTFNLLIPSDKYFETHPEFFSLIKGKRRKDSQLCLSNVYMRKVLIERLREFIKGEPDYWVYDVSQNDNNDYCTCRNCTKLAEKFGGQSGVMIWFVNQVADELKKTHPDKMIGTFAYHYTRNAPKNIIPRDNVVIRLCNIECCRAHDMEECEQNLSFTNDLKEWKKLSNNIFIWDYVVNFNQYIAPFPMDYRVLARNVQFYKKYGAIGIMAEGQYDSEWGEFSELKQWLLSKIMWNPSYDVDSLTHCFVNDYYGKAAPYIMQYYNLCRKQIKHNTHYNVYIECFDPVYTNSFVNEASAIIKNAQKVVSKDKEILQRVNRVAAQVYYIRIKRHGPLSITDGSLKSFKTIIKNDRTLIKEHKYTLEDMLTHDGYI